MRFILVFALLMVSISPAYSTTCCWDGTTLATDSQGTLGHHKTFNEQKLYRSEKRHASAAFGGYALACRLVADFFVNSDEPLSHCPLPKTDDPELGITILIIFDDGQVLLYGGDLFHLSMVEPPFAFGSGGDVALGAMLCGKTAKEAVEMAKTTDLYTGGEVISVKAPMLPGIPVRPSITGDSLQGSKPGN